MERIIIVEHLESPGRHYAFYVPDVINMIKPGTLILCDTSRGKRVARAVTPAFCVEGEEREQVLSSFGAREQTLRGVVGTYTYTGVLDTESVFGNVL